MTKCLHIFVVFTGTYAPTTVEDRAKRDAVIDVELDDLALKIDRSAAFQLENVPDKIRRLHGRRVRIHGYMYPPARESGLAEFLLNGETKQRPVLWTSGSAPLHFFISVKLRAGTTISYTATPLIVEGRFTIEPVVFEGKLAVVYKIDDAVVSKTKARRGFHRSIGFGC